MEIERKWLVKYLPDLKDLIPVLYERYFLYISDEVEIRIQKKGEKFELERKSQLSSLSRTEQRFDLTPQEYDSLKQLSNKSLIRESYLFQENPEVSIKVYKGEYEGLLRAEVEFSSEQDAQSFKPFDWFGVEITESPIGKDKLLVALSAEEFKKIISESN